MFTLKAPLTDLQLDRFILYFNAKTENSEDIRSLANAILDKRNGLGLIWNSTDFAEIEERLSHILRTYYISQVGKVLLDNIKMLQQTKERIDES